MKYTVIIPAYQAESTLERCLNSLLGQNRRDVQIILVSDGSTDGTDRIARSYGDRLEFIRQAHAGVSAARNRALALARGEYVCFADSDDFVSEGYFAKLDAEPDCDLLIFNLAPKLHRRLRLMNKTDKIDLLLRTDQITSACSKRIRRALLEKTGIRFPEGLQVGEDFCFSFALALAAESIQTSGACIYHADLSNENSLSRGYRPRLAEDMEKLFAIAPQPGQYLDTLDYLRARKALTCLAELWKAGRPEKGEIRGVCDRFRVPIGPVRGPVHGLLRLALRNKWDGLLFWAAYAGKGRKFCR